MPIAALSVLGGVIPIRLANASRRNSLKGDMMINARCDRMCFARALTRAIGISMCVLKLVHKGSSSCASARGKEHAMAPLSFLDGAIPIGLVSAFRRDSIEV